MRGASLRTLLGSVVLSLGVGCAGQAPAPAASPSPGPPQDALLGRFQDDYDNRYLIGPAEWVQLPHGRFRIVAWHLEQQYLIAQNDSANRHAPGRWTRIDWMLFTGMPPYTWGFCLTAYDAPTAAAAEATHPADRANPRRGCNGYPFSRMRPDTNSAGG